MLTLDDWTPDVLLKAVALVCALLTFIVGLLQYRRSQQWKRAEWVAQEMKAYFGDPIVQATFLMMDWGSRRIPLYPDQVNEVDRYVRLTNESVAAALELHDGRSEGFSDLEADIRNAFDRTLDGMERFFYYVETGLVELSDLAPYLRYWAVQLCRSEPPRAEAHRLTRLTAYMRRYGYDGALTLLKNIRASEQVVTPPSPP